MKHPVLISLLFLLPGLLRPQAIDSYVFRHIGTENGLAGSQVINIMQDHQGYIWISCGIDGLQRYDGEHFLTFRNDPSDSTSIPYGGAGALFEDSRGTIWCTLGEKHILVRYDPETRKFNRLYFKGKALERAYQFFEIQDRVYILCWEGVLRLDSTRRQVDQVASVPNRFYLNGTLDAEDRIWFWCDQGYQCYDTRSNRLYNAGNNPFHWKIFDEIVQTHGARAIYCNFKGEIWINDWSWDGFRFDPAKNTLARYTNAGWGAGSVSQFIEDDEHRLWAISNDRRLCRYVPEVDSFIYQYCRNEDPFAYHSGESGDEYPVALKDREGYFWVGNDKGLHIFHPTRQVVRTIRDGAAQLSERCVVNDIFQASNGDIFASHWFARLEQFDSSLQVKATYRNTPRHRFWQTAGMYTIEQDVYGRIWVGEESGWISLLDAQLQKLPPLHCEPCGRGPIRNILRAQNGDMWMNLRTPNIVRWDCKTRQFEAFSLSQPEVNFQNRSLLEDSRGNIWVGTSGQGLYCFDPVAKKVSTIFYDSTFQDATQPSNDVSAIFQWSPDTLLVCTEYGLKYLDLKNKVYGQHPLSAAFPCKVIYNILRDGHGNFWFSTLKGIFCADPSLTSLRSFGASEGFVDERFSPRSFFALHDGRIAAGTWEGNLVVFHPDSLLQTPPVLPAPLITDFEVFGKAWVIDSLLRLGRPVMLDHTQNAVSIFYGVLSFSRQEVEYEYRLSGQGDHWINAGKRRELFLTYLLPGTYRFEVRAVGPGQVRSPAASFTFVIRPPWYQSGWFYGLVFLAVLGTGFLVFRARIRRFRERASYEKRLSDLQNQALRAQINPHFIFNALQSVKKFVLLNDVDQAERYMSRFAQLIRQIMDNSREPAVSLRRELDLLDNYLQLEQLRYGHSFDYRFEMAEGVIPEEIETPSMTLQPFVENAVLHGLAHLKDRRGLLLVRCSFQGDGLLIEIEDNGVGRSRAEALKNPLRRQHHRSAGMDITAKRLTLFDAQARYDIRDLFDEAGNGRGTWVGIWLPVD